MGRLRLPSYSRDDSFCGPEGRFRPLANVARMQRRIDAVLFDFDHTLGVDHRLEERVLAELARRHCPTLPTEMGVAETLARFRNGSVSLKTALSEAFAQWGFHGDLVAEYKTEALRMLPSSLEARPGAGDTLQLLREHGLVVAILSNGWKELQRAKAALLPFDGPVIVSEEIGAWKPDREAFAIAGRRLRIDLGHSMYVGDSPVTDVAGSKAAGMIAVWADFEGQAYPDGVTPPDHTITRLDALVGLCATS